MTNQFDAAKAITFIEEFLQENLAASGLAGFVIGLSGGIDSALSATLAVRAVGAAKVLGISMPYRTSSSGSRTDAQALVAELGIEHIIVDITPMIDAYYPTIGPDERIRAGNKMARERMSILFDHAHQTHRMVLGTGNRTEICLGYTTLYGDAACSLNPIGQLYKTEVRMLAEELGVPETIRTKAPSADLWTDQTDEGEIGVTYEEIDVILAALVDRGLRSSDELTAIGCRPEAVARVIELLNRNWFKRELPPIAGLGRGPIPREISLV